MFGDSAIITAVVATTLVIGFLAGVLARAVPCSTKRRRNLDVDYQTRMDGSVYVKSLSVERKWWRRQATMADKVIGHN